MWHHFDLGEASHPSRRSRPQGPYARLIRELTPRYPILASLNYFFLHSPLSHDATHDRAYKEICVTILEFRKSEPVELRVVELSSLQELQEYLGTASQDAYNGRLYILEDLHPAYIEALGAVLNVDGTVFASQILATHYTLQPDRGNSLNLPSAQNSTNSFTLRYYEARHFKLPNKIPPFRGWELKSGNVVRQIDTVPTHQKGEYSSYVDVGLVRRNTSFWVHREELGGWNAVMLLDPPIRDEDIVNKASHGSIPYQGGYRDFTPWPSRSDLSLPNKLLIPPHDSFLHDIIYYWTCVASKEQIQEAISNPYQVSVFQRHIVAAIWFNTLENLQSVLSTAETLLWDLIDMISPGLTDERKEKFLKDFALTLHETNQIRRRVIWYVIEMENNLYQLGINPSSPLQPPSNESDDEKDFLAVYRKLVEYRSWSEKLVNLLISSMNLMETEKSISDSKSLSRLTYLGFVFIPLSFVATFFSMNGDFAVGQPLFWVFFVVALPFVFVVSVPIFWRLWSNKYWEFGLRHRRLGGYNLQVRNQGYKYRDATLLNT